MTTSIKTVRLKHAARRALPRMRARRAASRPALQTYFLLAAAAAIMDGAALLVLAWGFVGVCAFAGSRLSAHGAVMIEVLAVVAAVATAIPRRLYHVGFMLRPAEAAFAAMPSLICVVAVEAGCVAEEGGGGMVLIRLAAAALACGAFFIAGSRAAWAGIVRRGMRSGWLRYRVAVVGQGGQAVCELMARRPMPLADVIGLYDGAGPRAEDPVACLSELLARARRERVDAIILAYPEPDLARQDLAFSALRSSVADILLYGSVYRSDVLPSRHPLAALPVLPVQRRALTETDSALKGLFDRVAGSLILLFLMPLLALIAVAIKLDSDGPVLFRQPRVGYNNSLFMMYKFRSMQVAGSDMIARRQTVRGDKRVTRVGRFIRRFSLDEVPQVLNVIRGEMSLVGPRPHAPGTNIEGILLHHVAAGYPLRHRVLPGITGWAQINGSRGAMSSPEQIRRRVALDLAYIDHWSLWLDAKIIWRTLAAEVVSKSAW